MLALDYTLSVPLSPWAVTVYASTARGVGWEVGHAD